MKKKYFLTLLAFLTILSGCNNSSSSTEPVDSGGGSVWVAPEEVWVPNWEFTEMPAYTGNYWDGLDFDLRGKALADSVRAHIEGTFFAIDYTTAGNAVRMMDKDPWNDNRVLTIYDLRSRPNNGYNDWNREHVFPQSKLADGDPNLRAEGNVKNISSDAANLFASDWDVNSAKSNISLGEWNYEEDPEVMFKLLVRNTEGLLTDNVLRRGLFSPSWQSRGETARSQLYMILMYPDECGLNENFAVETMIKWTYDVPLYAERDGQRQAGLEQFQHMRNPFIDHKDLGCHIWGNTNSRTRALCASKGVDLDWEYNPGE